MKFLLQKFEYNPLYSIMSVKSQTIWITHTPIDMKLIMCVHECISKFYPCFMCLKSEKWFDASEVRRLRHTRKPCFINRNLIVYYVLLKTKMACLFWPVAIS